MGNEILDILKAIQIKIDSLENKMGSFENRMESFENRMESFENRIDSLENKMDHGFNEVNSKIDSLSHRVNEISNGLGVMVANEVGGELSRQLKDIRTDVKFVKRKVQDTEADVFVIQDHLSIVK